MLWVPHDDLLSIDVFEVVHEDFLGEHVDEGLNVRRHLFFIVSLDELAEVTVGERRHEELDVELVSGVSKGGELDG